MITQKWWQSKVTLLALAALVAFITTKWFGFTIPGWSEFVDLVLVVLAGVGVLNNGFNPIGFGANTIPESKKIVDRVSNT